MKAFWKFACPLILAGLLISAVFAQRAFRQYPSVEYGESIPLPMDWSHPAEWTFARLMYPPGPLDGYAAFGHVTKNMDLVRKIARLPAQQQMLLQPIKIVSIRRVP